MSSHHKLKRDCTPEEWRAYLDKMRPHIVKWKLANPERVREMESSWRKSHPDRMRIIVKGVTKRLKINDPDYSLKRTCRSKLNNELRSGRVVKPNTCSSCFVVGLITAHHEDYTKPLQVDWLCPKCHKRLHQKRKKGAVAR